MPEDTLEETVAMLTMELVMDLAGHDDLLGEDEGVAEE